MRLIDADALTTDISFFDGENYHYGYSQGMINSAPTIDAVEVVRCKDCRWGHLCVFGQHLGLDGFCSKGERKEQNDGQKLD